MPFRLKPTPLALNEIHLITLYNFPSTHFKWWRIFLVARSLSVEMTNILNNRIKKDLIKPVVLGNIRTFSENIKRVFLFLAADKAHQLIHK